jgi:hypothetical protein
MSRGSGLRSPQMTINLMAAGDGTPWEDRGNVGVIVAFIRTAIQSMASPAKLMDSMRRPELPADATRFSIACGLMWALSVLVHAVIGYFQLGQQVAAKQITLDTHQFWINTAIQAIAAAGVTVMGLKLAANVYFKLITKDLTQPIRPVLVYNAMGYGLGPSVLAPIPYVGPPAAAIWIFINWVVVGTRRLRAKTGGAAVAAALTFAALTAAVLVGYGVGHLVASNLLGWNSVVPIIHRVRGRGS